MNWYKKAIETETETETEIPITYESFGHSDYETMETDPNNPNYIWIFFEGNVLAREETGDVPTHQDAFSLLGIPMVKVFRGRYDSKQDVITIIKPYGAATFRPIPDIVVHRLREKFSPTAEIMEFS